MSYHLGDFGTLRRAPVGSFGMTSLCITPISTPGLSPVLAQNHLFAKISFPAKNSTLYICTHSISASFLNFLPGETVEMHMHSLLSED